MGGEQRRRRRRGTDHRDNFDRLRGRQFGSRRATARANAGSMKLNGAQLDAVTLADRLAPRQS